jgi:hypothetical protein
MPQVELMRRGASDRIARVRRVVTRATGWPMAIRFAIFLAALAAQAFAYPAQLLGGSPALVVVLLAALPAFFPRTLAVTVYYLVVVVGWVASTTFYYGVATLPRLIGMAAALYLVHSGAALAAVLPYDAVVSTTVVVRWGLRIGLSLVLSLGLSVAGLFETVRLGTRTYLAASVVGLLITIGVVWVLAAAAGRRR